MKSIAIKKDDLYHKRNSNTLIIPKNNFNFLKSKTKQMLMKNKLRKTATTLVLGLTAMLLSNILYGQSQSSAQNLSNQKQVVKVTGAPQNIMPVPNSEFKRSSSGVLTSENGAVQVIVKNPDGSNTVKVFQKPSVNTKAVSKVDDMNIYTKEMKDWITHNPDFKNFLNKGQLDALGTGNLKALYLYDFENAMNQNKTTH